MRVPRQLATILLAALAVQCKAPRPQWVVHLSTDAPVPQLGDRLLLEVLDDGGGVCESCRRLVPITSSASFPVTFGVAPGDVNKAPRIRARLFRQAATGDDGEPAGAAYIDAAGKLPPLLGAHEILDVALQLRMDCFGVPGAPSSALTCDPSTSALAAEPEIAIVEEGSHLDLAAGSWPAGIPVPCIGEVPEGMVCVPGGAFLLGTVRETFGGHGETSPRPERLVRLSPFAMDVDEMTVGAARAVINEHGLTSEPVAPGGDPVSEPCKYRGRDDPSNDDQPLNCVSLPLAQLICEKLGKRLPTEAEWEFAAGNLGAEDPYPWGADDDVCARAVVAMGRTTVESPGTVEYSTCRTAQDTPTPWGPRAGGHPLDVTQLGIHNMAGNLDEWVEDAFARYTDSCWHPEVRMLIDPVCEKAPVGQTPAYAMRGSSWVSVATAALAAARNASLSPNPLNGTGFRCALSM